MTLVGEIVKGRGSDKYSNYIYVVCADCGEKRWIKYHKNHVAIRCKHCNSIVLGNGLSKNYRQYLQGDKHPMWKGGRITTQRGYIELKIPRDDFYYSMATKHGYILEHRLVIAKHLGRCLHSWEVVHHKNGVKNDNMIKNLELNIQGGHISEHNKGYKDGYAKGYFDGKDARIKILQTRIKELEVNG